jgi:hypothetical protein
MIAAAAVRRPSPVNAMADVAHDARGAVGTIRLAVTALLDIGDDAAVRDELLGSVAEEASRLALELAALAPLVGALTDRAKPAPVDIVEVLRRAGADVAGEPVLLVLARPTSLDAALAALLALVGATTAEIDDVTAPATVRLPGARLPRPDSRLVDYLVRGIGATSRPGVDGLTLEFPT